MTRWLHRWTCRQHCECRPLRMSPQRLPRWMRVPRRCASRATARRFPRGSAPDCADGMAERAQASHTGVTPAPPPRAPAAALELEAEPRLRPRAGARGPTTPPPPSPPVVRGRSWRPSRPRGRRGSGLLRCARPPVSPGDGRQRAPWPAEAGQVRKVHDR